jgi:hypothetical protein
LPNLPRTFEIFRTKDYYQLIMPGTANVNVDVLIVGSGPIGAVFAHELVNHPWKNNKTPTILMIDIGPQSVAHYVIMRPKHDAHALL